MMSENIYLGLEAMLCFAWPCSNKALTTLEVMKIWFY